MAEENEFKFPEPEELKKIKGFQIQENGTCKGLKARSYQVHRYSELVYLVSLLRFHNQNQFILYRGESKQHTNDNGILSFLPGIYRNENNTNDFKLLKEKTSELLKFEELKNVNQNYSDIIAQGLLQHYEIVRTPFLDLTQSLRVAYSMAFNEAKKKPDNRETIFIYLFNVPFFNGYITKIQDFTLVNLPAVCPPTAMRPLLQEGYLIRYNKEESYDFNQNLIAEIEIDRKDLENPNLFAHIPTNSLTSNPFDLFDQFDSFKDNIKKLKNK